MTLHLEGMGVMGSLIAVGLMEQRIPFTWSDCDEPHKLSWRASTGAVLPFGDAESERNLLTWHEMLEHKRWKQLLGPHTTRAVYCYVTENPPHNGKRTGVVSTGAVGPVKVSNRWSLHMDVQRFVRSMQRELAYYRQDGPERRDTVLVTHGFGDNIYKWSWGWSAIVRAEFDPRIHALCEDDIPMLYGRRGFQLPYLYPVGATGKYYAGTTLITQPEPKSLNVQPKYDTWLQHVHDYTDGNVRVRGTPKSLMEAWRPMAHPDAELVECSRRLIKVRPQYGNGIRLFPNTLEAILEAM